MNLPKQTIFLDTSVQVQRILSSETQRTQYANELSRSAITFVTSAYVWMEFQRTVVADYAHVHREMENHSDWGGLFEHILDKERAFHPRSAVRCTKIIGQAYKRSQRNYKFARQDLSNQIAYELNQKFWQHVTSLDDAIVCDLVQTGVIRQPNRNYTVPASCRKESAACQLPSFLAAHQPRLSNLVTYLVDHPNVIKDQARFERLLTAIIADPRAALGQTSCWPLGDLIIALQVPASALLWTLDADFVPLAEALGIVLYRPGVGN